MATEQRKIVVYLPQDEGDEFQTIVEASGGKMASVIRLLIREYVAKQSQAEVAA